MWTFIFRLLMKLPGLAEKFIDYQAQKLNVELEGFRTAAGIDVQAYTVYTNAMVETNRIKLAQNSWWGAKMIILTAGWPCSVHMAAIMMDSLPFYIPLFMSQAHVIGSWGIPKPPPPYDDYQRQIVLSFFIIMPAMPIVSAVAQWLGRKR